MTGIPYEVLLGYSDAELQELHRQAGEREGRRAGRMRAAIAAKKANDRLTRALRGR